MLRRVALVRTDVSEELSASFIRVTRIGELGTTPTVTSNRRTLKRKFLRNVGSYKSHSVTSQKTPFVIVTDVKTSNPTMDFLHWFDSQQTGTLVHSSQVDMRPIQPPIQWLYGAVS
jgi:hypothetical protein